MATPETGIPSARAYILKDTAGMKRDVAFVGIDDTMGVVINRIGRDATTGRCLFEVPVQDFTFFATGSDNAESDGLGVAYKKTVAETTLLRGRETPSAAAIAVEGLSMARRGCRVLLDTTTPDIGDGIDASITALQQWADFKVGKYEIVDRAGLILPFELGGHPGFLEDVMDSIRSRSVLEVQIGRKSKGDPIRCDRIPCGDATSGLRAAGDPLNANRYKLPTGYVWKPTGGGADADFSVKFSVPRAFGITMNAPVHGFSDGSPVAYPNFSKALVEYTLRLHGLSSAPLSING